MHQPEKEPLHSQDPYDPPPKGSSESRSKSTSWGTCCFFGCLFSFLVLILLGVGGGLAGYWWVQGQVEQWTSATPADLPVVELSEEQVQEIKDRVDAFQEAVDEGRTPEELVLTAEEINALISSEEELKGRVYVRIDEGQISGDVSIPTDFLPGGKGRYFNASATFNASLDNGVLIVTLAGAEVRGEQVPEQIIEGMSKENLAKDVYKDPEVAEALRRFESLRIENDKIILTPRPPDEDAPADAGEEATVDESPVEEAPSDAEPADADAEPADADAGPADADAEPANADAEPADEESPLPTLD